MTTFRELAAEIADVMRVPSPVEDQAAPALVLSRAAAQLAHRLTQADERVTAMQMDWLRMADPAATDATLRTLARKFGTSTDISWLENCAASPEEALPLALGLLILLPDDKSETPTAWPLAVALIEALGITVEHVFQLWGWLNAAANETVHDTTEALLEHSAASGPFSQRIVMAARADRERRANRDPDREYVGTRTQVRDLVLTARAFLDAMNIPSVRDAALLNYLAGDAFRLTVLGEFKRGKSTFINALLKQPTLLPVDDLPCTSSIIELRAGPAMDFERRFGLLADWTPATESAFRLGAGHAHERRSTMDKCATGADTLDYWRVSLPNEVLASSNIVIVDTPGLGEDPVRDRIARAEAERADAAILLLSAQQLATSLELQLLDILRTKCKDLFIVINFADQKAQADWERLIDHLQVRLQDEGIRIPRNRIFMLSAGRADEALRTHEHSDEWVLRMNAFLDSVRVYLHGRHTAARRTRLTEHAKSFIHEAEHRMKQRLEEVRKRRTEVANRATERKKKRTQRNAAQQSLNEAIQDLRDYRQAATALTNAFEEELSFLIMRLDAHSGTWQSVHSPVFSPRKFAEDMAAEARDEMLRGVEHWIERTGISILSHCVEETANRAHSKLFKFEEYIGSPMGGQGDEIWNELRHNAIRTAFSEKYVNKAVSNGFAVGLVNAATPAIVAIIMRWLFSMINPAVLATTAFRALSFGSTINDTIRETIVQQLAKELESESQRKEIRSALEHAVRDLYYTHAEGFRITAEPLLKEIEFQEREAEQRFHEAEERLGQEAALREEEAKLERLAADAGATLLRLQAIIQ